MSGKAVGDTLANQGLFPSVHPEVKNPVMVDQCFGLVGTLSIQMIWEN